MFGSVPQFCYLGRLYDAILYASFKTGVGVHIGDMGLNVLFDLLNYAAEIDSAAIAAADGTSTIKPKRFITKAVRKLKSLDNRAAQRFEENSKT